MVARMPDELAGIVYLVGAGPGDAGLITVRGRALLGDCDAIVYDALANPVLFADVNAELHDVGKRGGAGDASRQEDINALLVRLAREGKRVVRLKGGDPFVFGRGSEEAQALAANEIPFEIVPGVTAGVAVPAYAGIPVTHRGLAASVTFVTGHEDPAKGTPTVDWRALARAGGTLVLYMAVSALPRIVDELLAAGLPADTPAAAIRWGTYNRQETVTATLDTLLASVKQSRMTAPVITVIGRVVGLRDVIGWFESRPLSGRRILVTRAHAQASALATRLSAAGADVVELPATRIEPLDPAPLGAALARLASYDWIVFTSQNAVELFWAGLRRAGRDARALAAARVAAIGPATADALLNHGVAADVTPARFVAEALLDALAARSDVAGTCVLYATAEGARDVLPKGLVALGTRVDVLPLYRSVPQHSSAEPLRAALSDGELSLATVTSASAVEALVEATRGNLERMRRAPVASIGPVTSAAARAAGFDVVVEANQATIPSLVEAIIRHFHARAVAGAS
jgi:uroporphyrinogen III methyltransferase/synthase